MLNMFESDGISQAFLPFRFVDIIIITDHYLFLNVGQANYIVKYFENMMIDHIISIMCRFFPGKQQFCLLWRGVIKTRGDCQSIQLQKCQESVVLYEKYTVH